MNEAAGLAREWTKVLEKKVNFSFEVRQVANDSIPHQLKVDPEVGVNEFISHAGDGLPRYVRVSFFQGDGHAFRRLPYDFKVTHDRVLSFSIGKETILSRRCIINDVLDGVSSVQKLDAVVLHRGTASACIRSWR